MHSQCDLRSVSEIKHINYVTRQVPTLMIQTPWGLGFKLQFFHIGVCSNVWDCCQQLRILRIKRAKGLIDLSIYYATHSKS